jgi:3-phosphoinositide dependent protein kinase-1
VGTVNFIAPEMIKECESTCASDLWALGCIIFKMFTGKVPFPGMSETQVFPLILSRKIDWPKGDMDPVVKDLIDKLLQLEPLDRLGCPMTGHDMKSLMRHPFFEGIHFSSDLSKTTDVRALLAESEI